MIDPLVSIVTVSFNCERTIERTIKSVRDQTYKNIEYIIIDGLSTDKTINIIKYYESEFNGNLKWISEIDNGLYHAMNKGVKRATGEFIGILNSDDWYELNSVEVIVESFVKDPELQLVHGNMARYNSNNSLISIYGKRTSKFNFLDKTPYSHPTCFIKTGVYKNYGNFDTQFNTASDYDFMLRIYYSNIKTLHIDRLITNVQLVGITTSLTWPPFKQNIAILKKHNIDIFKIAVAMIWLFFSRVSYRIIKLFKLHFIINIYRKQNPLHKYT